MKPVRVLLADDHALVRRGIARMLAEEHGLEVVGEASDGLEALQKARELQPDVVLMDIYMPGCDGITATRLIRQELPEVRVVILTVSEEEQSLFEAIKSGAHGFLLKKIEPPELAEMVKAAARGEAPISRATAARIIEEFSRLSREGPPRDEEPLGDLTRREREVLSLVARGLGNKQVAAELDISENTVRNHLRNILDKLHLHNRVEAAAYAIRRGLAPDGPGSRE